VGGGLETRVDGRFDMVENIVGDFAEAFAPEAATVVAKN
jgi:hypothetical protein